MFLKINFNLFPVTRNETFNILKTGDCLVINCLKYLMVFHIVQLTCSMSNV